MLYASNNAKSMVYDVGQSYFSFEVLFYSSGDLSLKNGSRSWDLKPLIVDYMMHSFIVNMKSMLMLSQQFVVSVIVTCTTFLPCISGILKVRGPR